jgi:DNA-binding CsgD family transcriptional regulator/PAS domain-containing protein
MREPNLDELLDLAGEIYDTALSADAWDPLLDRLTACFEGTAAVFFVRDRRGATPEFGHLWGLPQAALDDFQRHFAPLDPGLDTLLAHPSGSVLTEDDTPRDVHQSSEFFNDFRRPWGIERYIATDVFRDARRFGVLAIQASRRRAAFGESEKALLATLHPHLRRAVQMRSQLDQTCARERSLEAVVEGLLVGVIVLDDRGEILHANAAARSILRSNDGLRAAERRLRAAAPADDRALQAAVVRAIDTTKRVDLAGGGIFAVQRPSGERPYALLVNPGPGVDSRSAFRIASAIVMIGDPDAGLSSSAQLVARLYGLTPAEARLAKAIASGGTQESYSAAQRISISTTRWTLKRVLAKTGARRQADLVRLLLTGPAAIGKPPEDA